MNPYGEVKSEISPFLPKRPLVIAFCCSSRNPTTLTFKANHYTVLWSKFKASLGYRVNSRLTPLFKKLVETVQLQEDERQGRKWILEKLGKRAKFIKELHFYH